MNQQKRNILIVEDEYITALDLKIQFILKGFSNLDIVASGEDAVKRALNDRLDLIVMDIKLKGEMDGIEASEIIRQKSDVPIVYVSGNSDLLKSDRLKKTKPDAILKKPISEYEVTKILNKVFN